MGNRSGKKDQKKATDAWRNRENAGPTAEEEIVRIMKGALDRLQQEITIRFTRLRD